MLAMAPEVKVYVAVGATDMRKSINGLSCWSRSISTSTCFPAACSPSATGAG